MVLEGALVTIACIALTVAHPGKVFGEYWKTSKTGSKARSELELGKSDVEMHASPI